MPTPQEYQALLEGGCPYCGEALEIKHGKFGEFVACREWCGYTKGVPGWSYRPPEKETKCSLGKCGGLGLLPFVKNGKVIANAWIDCDCKDTGEYHQSLTPADFDFPCSGMFRNHYEILCGGQQDPIEKEREESPPTEIIHRHSNMGKAEFDLLQQTVLKVTSLGKRLDERKPGKKGIKFTIRP